MVVISYYCVKKYLSQQNKKYIAANAERPFLKYSRAEGTYLQISGPEFKQTEITRKSLMLSLKIFLKQIADLFYILKSQVRHQYQRISYQKMLILFIIIRRVVFSFEVSSKLVNPRGARMLRQPNKDYGCMYFYMYVGLKKVLSGYRIQGFIFIHRPQSRNENS